METKNLKFGTKFWTLTRGRFHTGAVEREVMRVSHDYPYYQGGLAVVSTKRVAYRPDNCYPTKEAAVQAAIGELEDRIEELRNQ